MIILGQRIRLDLNNVQATWMERCAGAARYIFNLGLARWQEIYETGGNPNWRAINAEVNARKSGDLTWLKEIPWAVPNNALQDLNSAFQQFFRRMKAGQKPGYPRFKSKKHTKPAFAIENRAVQFSNKRVKLPKLGWIKTRQKLRFPGMVLSARFSKHAGHWYLSVQVEVDESWIYPHRCETQAVCGVDMGVVDLAVVSDGTKVSAPRILRQLEKRLRMLNKQLSRRTKGGKNRLKAKAQLQRLHERIANVRRDVTHNLTARLVRNFRWIGIEDLNVAGMARTRLAKSVMDAAMAEAGRQLLYKAPLAGSAVVQADRWYPSSKLCSDCGTKREGPLPLSIREWVCEFCGVVHDRDVNAAINLRTAALAGIARCQGSAGVDLRTGVKLPLGQESSSYVNPG